ncbi:hypothetical protein BGZ60DRAFT_113309 [Tricladium varicosporioides]|nr:hypothetical protein BGZ60DRAFT_113309 [Hymenoscyphus varicosporioides]
MRSPTSISILFALTSLSTTAFAQTTLTDTVLLEAFTTDASNRSPSQMTTLTVPLNQQWPCFTSTGNSCNFNSLAISQDSPNAEYIVCGNGTDAAGNLTGRTFNLTAPLVLAINGNQRLIKALYCKKGEAKNPFVCYEETPPGPYYVDGTCTTSSKSAGTTSTSASGSSTMSLSASVISSGGTVPTSLATSLSSSALYSNSTITSKSGVASATSASITTSTTLPKPSSGGGQQFLKPSGLLLLPILVGGVYLG